VGTTYNLILPVCPAFRPDNSVADRIRAKFGEGSALAAHLGYSPDVAFTREVTAQVKVGLNTYVLLSNEATEVSHFAVVITDALRRDYDAEELSFSAEAPDEAMCQLTEIVGVALRQVSCKGLIIVEGEELRLDD
jgi:hypothetical protein